ncbi:aminoglycoside phosphotransferase family protein [Paenibacillus tengchongensis]|uniref:aminoglycoside phosphotransferase family protein n=1 Tax=Paenibacillus tengchongensis TaxID=2608684 RepID=UPI0016525688|nr:aminoglycoside phosphotransferase family protein [Paenibacillus tengchongensis]
MAKLTERRTMHRLLHQSANVPFSLTYDLESEDRALLCIQDVDYKTDYQNLEIEKLQHQEIQTLAFIHRANHGLHSELAWLPVVDRKHMEEVVERRWRPFWEEAKRNEAFIGAYGSYIPEIDAAARSIVDDMQPVVNEVSSHTLIHNDLNPGNVLVHSNQEVMFIDWEEARYGPLFLDIPMRLNPEQADEYRDVLGSHGIVLPAERFRLMYATAARYLGIRYMTWCLGAWTRDAYAKNMLERYLQMAAGTSL